MSSNSVVYNSGQLAIINFDTSKIFIWNNRYFDADFTNSTYDPIQLYAGTLMGRISATGKIVPCKSTAVDGSEIPRGILHEDALVDEGETRSLSICSAGDVVQNYVILATGDTLDTLVNGVRLRDRIAADTVGIILIPSRDLTGYDNQ